MTAGCCKMRLGMLLAVVMLCKLYDNLVKYAT